MGKPHRRLPRKVLPQITVLPIGKVTAVCSGQTFSFAGSGILREAMPFISGSLPLPKPAVPAVSAPVSVLRALCSVPPVPKGAGVSTWRRSPGAVQDAVFAPRSVRKAHSLSLSLRIPSRSGPNCILFGPSPAAYVKSRSRAVPALRCANAAGASRECCSRQQKSRSFHSVSKRRSALKFLLCLFDLIQNTLHIRGEIGGFPGIICS